VKPSHILRALVSWALLLVVAPGVSGHALLHAHLLEAPAGGEQAAERWSADLPGPAGRAPSSDTRFALSCPGCGGVIQTGALTSEEPIAPVLSVGGRALQPREARSDPLRCAWSPDASRAPPTALS
jgi:hypothetical protein